MMFSRHACLKMKRTRELLLLYFNSQAIKPVQGILHVKMVNVQTLVTSLLRKSPLQASAPIDNCKVYRSVAAVACIIRPETADGIQSQAHSLNARDLTSLLLSTGDNSKASMLFIKRAVRKGDRWSGDGGYCCYP